MTPGRRIATSPVFWVVVPLFMVLVPHFPRLPLWMLLLISVLLLWRLGAVVRPGLMPPKWLLLIIALLTAGGTLLHYGTLFGKTAGTAILSVLLGIKLLESQGRRDYMLLIALSFFIVVTNFLYSQSIPTVIYMLVTVVILVTSLVSINQDNAPLPLKPRLRLSARLVLQAMPLMLVLFVLFPRIPGPLWKLPDDTTGARTGLSDTMTPGSIAELIESNEVAFRVAFDGNIPSQRHLYWRAQVFWYFDGRTWEKGKNNPAQRVSMEGLSRPASYTLTLEPHDRDWLFALDMPTLDPTGARYTADYLLRAGNRITSLQRYRLTSYLTYRVGLTLHPWERSAGLRLPDNSNPRSVALGRQWRTQLEEPEAIVQKALSTFNQQDYHYTLRPPLTPGFDPVDQFLFETRAGFCEHYASSFTLLMRAAGIPARVVIGYQGGTRNPINNNLTVRQSDAHAWSEVWLAGRGWVRIDPTAAIAPQRIERSLDAALPENAFRPLHMRMDAGLIKKLNFYLDALDDRWNQFVIGYGPKLQRKFLSDLMDSRIDIGDMVLLLVGALLLVTLIILFFILRQARPPRPDPCQQLYLQFCSKLARHGLVRPPHEGPADFAARARQRFPQHAERIEQIATLYINDRYRDRRSERQLRQMKKLIGRLRLA